MTADMYHVGVRGNLEEIIEAIEKNSYEKFCGINIDLGGGIWHCELFLQVTLGRHRREQSRPPDVPTETRSSAIGLNDCTSSANSS